MKKRLALILGLLFTAAPAFTALVWFTCRIYVPEGYCAVLTRKTGKIATDGSDVIAPDRHHRGIQRETLGPGRHFKDPYNWSWTLQPLTEISAGDPKSWEWIHSLNQTQRNQLRSGNFTFKGEFPSVGVVTRKVGKTPPKQMTVVPKDSEYRGILREVLSPGTYKLNPEVYKVEVRPATVIPAGFVGVVTNQIGEVVQGMGTVADGEQIAPLAEEGQRGTLRDVLQPGVYFINPYVSKVTLIEIGFNEYSQLKMSEEQNFRIAFPSDTGYEIRVGVTVVWGILPQHAAEIINEFGNIDRVLDKVIGPQLRSICRNIGSTYAARDFIQGEKREIFQRDLTEKLQSECRSKNIEVLLALVREIEVHAPSTAGRISGEVTEDLKRTIQQSYIAIENQLTKEKQREAAAVRAQLEEVEKQIDIARETIQADTRVMVADILAEGAKQSAEIDAQAELEVATIRQQVAELEAQRTEILGKARADVSRMKKDAEAQGYKMLVDAFGSPQAFNLYRFSENFEPKSIRLFFAGEGTFWTDLTRFEDVGSAKILQNGQTVGHKAP